MSSDTSEAFFLLDERIQRFIWAEGWEELRDAQEAAIPQIARADRDVIIAAATAAGKTEAAFLPALTHLLQNNSSGLIVYISPLKALINDQLGRLELLCEQLEVPVWPWHGDISSSTKARFLKQPHGVLLITPESLEAMLCNRGTAVKSIFASLSFLIVDELHAFIGSERGKQLQSLMHRIEHVVARKIPRIGLSATLGNMALAADFLRPSQGINIAIVDAKGEGKELRVLVKGFEEPVIIGVNSNSATDPTEEIESDALTPRLIAEHLFKNLRGSNNLVFPNSRREVERYTHLLNDLCDTQRIANEFWPHHGSLSKEIRAETELALKQKALPASAICTNTLELGIDIGAVKSIAQIGSPPSVASLRQRLGRSGRRKGEPAILRGYCIEAALDGQSSLRSELRLGTIQMVAMIELMREGWFEPPMAEGLHYSTLIQQLLSHIAQNGGATIGELFDILCKDGAPFSGINKQDFIHLIRYLGEKDLLMQDQSDLLLHGQLGEKFVNHYTFYAAFTTDEEFRIVSGSKTLGTMPISQMLITGQRILFAGRTWHVDEVDEEQKTIYVSHAKGGTPPLFAGGGGRTHTKVRQRMRELLESSDIPPYLDNTAQRFLSEARQFYSSRNLKNKIFIDQGREIQLLTWLGDSTNEAIACLLIRRGYMATPGGPGVEVQKGLGTTEDIIDSLIDASVDDPPPLDLLLADVKNICFEKWDWALPDELLRKSYASLRLNLNEALAWSKHITSIT